MFKNIKSFNMTNIMLPRITIYSRNQNKILDMFRLTQISAPITILSEFICKVNIIYMAVKSH